MKNTKKRVVVTHTTPDLEALFLTWLVKWKPVFIKELNVDADAPTKFIPSGPLRAEDFPEAETLSGPALEEDGYVFFDCGGGRYDQHGNHRNAEQNQVTSWDLLNEDLWINVTHPWLMPIGEIISANDRSAQAVAHDTGRKQSATPHTSRTIRTLVTGLNMMWPNDPDWVEEAAHRFFNLMEQATFRMIDKAAGKPGAYKMTDGVELAKKNGADFSKLFLLEFYLAYVEATVRALPGMSDPRYASMTFAQLREDADSLPEDVQKQYYDLTEMADLIKSAMEAMEQDWEQAERDYWDPRKTTVKEVFTPKPGSNGGTVHAPVTVVIGKSTAQRFGEVSRLGNQGKKRPNRNRPYRAKADVTIQLRGNGMYTVVTRGGIQLENVATVVREADLYLKRVRLTRPQRELLACPGNLRFVNLDGETVETAYFAEFRTAFGNAFRSNPHSAPTALNDQELVHFTLCALSGMTFEQIRGQLRGDGSTDRGSRGHGGHNRQDRRDPSGATIGDLVAAKNA